MAQEIRERDDVGSESEGAGGGDEGGGGRGEESVWRKAMPPGCVLKPGLLAAAALVGGVYLMGRWEHLGGMARAGSVVLVLMGSLVLLPIFGFVAVTVVGHYFMKEMKKSLGEVVGPMREVVAKNKALFTEEYETREATEEDFAGLDRAWYEATTGALTELGFRHAGDEVNITIQKATGMTTVIREMIGPDGTTIGLMYHVPMAKLPARLEGKKMLTVEFETEFSDETFLTTANTAETNLATAPPGIHSVKHPMETAVGDVLASHEKEKANLLAAKGGANCVVMSALKDITECHRRQQLMKAKFRKGIGYVDPEEVRRIATANKQGDAVIEIATAGADIARREEQGK